MSGRVVVLRPQPGADETAERARSLGLEPVVAPLFAVRPLAWQPPRARGFDAVLMTSANAARFAGAGLAPLRGLPCYAVGARTAAAAREAGFAGLRIGGGDAAELLATMAADGIRRAFHPCGREHLALDQPGLEIVRVPVYAADALDRLAPEAIDAARSGAVVLLHSPRAAATFARLAQAWRGEAAIAAISPAAAEAAGTGWRAVAVAGAPRDPALLEVAAKLCQSDGA